jgi:AraC-like DNA-binding protein
LSVYSPMLGALWRLLEKKGRNPEDYIPRKIYHPDHGVADMHRLGFDDFIKIHISVTNEFQEPTLGLQLGACVHPSHLGALGYAFLASSSLRTAFYRSQRFLRMVHARLVARIDEWPGHMRVAWDLNAPVPFANQFAESRLASALTMSRMNFGNELRPLEVSLSRKQPDDVTPWEQFFDCPVRFAAKDDAITFAESDVKRFLTASNRELVSLHEEAVRRHIRSMDQSGIVHRVKAMIVEEMPNGRVTESLLAERLHISQRTLQRRLREEGETFHSLLTRVRKNLASHFLREPGYSIIEIAFLLGFSDSSAFSRAYRDWFGESPSMTRDAQTE